MPVALAQALTLGLNVSTGGVDLQAAKDISFATEIVYDLSGKPFNYLILTGPGVQDFWGTITNPAPDAKYTLYATGATDKRSFFSFILPQSYFKVLLRAKAKAGSYKRFLSPLPGMLYLEDASGRVRDVDTAQPVNSATLDQQRQTQASIFAQREKDGILNGIKGDWDKLREEAAKKGLTQSGGLPSLGEVTLPNGNLNARKLIEALENQINAKGVRPMAGNSAYPYERGWCEGWFCAGLGFAGVVRKNRQAGDITELNNNKYNVDNPQDKSRCDGIYQSRCIIADGIVEGDPLGNNQWINSYRYAPSDGIWGAWDFGMTGLNPLDYVGCGPLAITRLFAWYGIYRSAFNDVGSSRSNINLVNSTTVPGSASGVAYEMYDPVALNSGTPKYYQPKIARYTDTWYFNNGGVGNGFTRDINMTPGANNWIRDFASAEGKNWELRGTYKAFVNLVQGSIVAIPIYYLDFAGHTWGVNNIVRDKIGRDNEPVIAMYGQGINGHFALVQAYISHQGWFSANVLAWITARSDDETYKKDLLPGRYVNITDAAAYYSGTYGLFRR